jgi:hypothetical protein
MGIGDWGLGIGPNPQSPIPNPQSPSNIKNSIKYKYYLMTMYSIILKRIKNLLLKFKN